MRPCTDELCSFDVSSRINYGDIKHLEETDSSMHDEQKAIIEYDNYWFVVLKVREGTSSEISNVETQLRLSNKRRNDDRPIETQGLGGD